MEGIKELLINLEWYHIIIVSYIIGAIWLIWEAKNAPTYPDDYDKDYPN
jgi:hypothetical protein